MRKGEKVSGWKIFRRASFIPEAFHDLLSEFTRAPIVAIHVVF